MLMLTRRPGESIVIDGHIEIFVQEIMVGGTYSNQVRLGIIAKKEITVHRKEIQQKIDKETAK
jgi:carbon storage regulator